MVNIVLFTSKAKSDYLIAMLAKPAKKLTSEIFPAAQYLILITLGSQILYKDTIRLSREPFVFMTI